MLVVVALLVWFALSVPTTVILGRLLTGAGDHTEAPARARPVVTSGHSPIRR